MTKKEKKTEKEMTVADIDKKIQALAKQKERIKNEVIVTSKMKEQMLELIERRERLAKQKETITVQEGPVKIEARISCNAFGSTDLEMSSKLKAKLSFKTPELEILFGYLISDDIIEDSLCYVADEMMEIGAKKSKFVRDFLAYKKDLDNLRNQWCKDGNKYGTFDNTFTKIKSQRTRKANRKKTAKK